MRKAAGMTDHAVAANNSNNNNDTTINSDSTGAGGAATSISGPGSVIRPDQLIFFTNKDDLNFDDTYAENKQNESSPALPFPATLQPNQVSFFTLGDWGENTYHLHVIGCEMAKRHESNPVDFVVALGDNFYEDGVDSVDDPLWTEVFENNFPDVTCPWYPVLGNHDYHTNPTAQIEYARDPRWQMPSKYYSKIFGSFQFVFIDTTTLCPQYSKMITGLRHFSKEDATTQYKWLKHTLATSTADWLLVFGHYPVFSGGENGSTRDLIEPLEKVFGNNAVDAYFCGHDHSMQHLYSDKSDVHYFVNGAGCGRHGTLRQLTQTVSHTRTPGFQQCTLIDERLRVQFISYEGNELYSFDVAKKGKRKKEL